MTEQTVIVEEGQYRVIAVQDDSPHQPEWQGYPSAIISHDWRHTSITESWKGALDTDRIQDALNRLEDDVFDRWVRVFGDDLVDRKAAGLEEDDPAAKVYVQQATGYSQGDVWTLLTWAPEGSEEPDVDSDDLVNWARGDAFILDLQKKVTWTTEEDGYEDREEWETEDSVGGIFAQWPDEVEWVLETAKDMIPA